MAHLRFLSSLTLLPACLLTATTSFAVDGVLELNQTCAISTGCVRGDDPGFPISIDGGDGRSYRLTSDLLIGDANTSGVEIASTADGVSLDLNGFSIRGVTSCTGNGQNLACAPTGAGRGINSAAQRTHVHDGHVVGMGDNGVQILSGGLIEGVTVSESGNFGFGLGSHTVIRHSTSTRNGLHGFGLSPGSIVNNCASASNGGDGYLMSSAIQVKQSSATSNGGSGFRSIGTSTTNLQGNTAFANNGHGITVGSRSTIRNNSLEGNGLTGISADASSVIEGNTIGNSDGVGINAAEGSVINNNAVADSDEGGIVAGIGSVIRGNSVLSNGTNLSHDGIHCSLGCRVQDNTLRSNGGFGLRFDSNSSGYSGNTIGSNGAGSVSLGRDTGSNVCGTATTCP